MPLLPGGTCGSVQTSNFFATLSSDFTFSTTENPGLTTPGPEGSQTLEYSGGNPYIGVVKFDGPDPYHPCFLPSGQTAPSPTNQVISFNFVDGNPKAKPATGGANGTGSCWLITYNMPNEAPTVSITDGPSNNQDIPLNTPLNATFTCNAVNNSNVSVGGQPVGAVGPYLTVNSCTLTDTYTGAGSPAVISATAGSASANGSGAIDTTNPGPHTLVATVMDSAGNTISTSTITYNVQGSSSTVVSSSPNPSTYGQLVTFTATVTGVGSDRASDVDRDPGLRRGDPAELLGRSDVHYLQPGGKRYSLPGCDVVLGRQLRQHQPGDATRRPIGQPGQPEHYVYNCGSGLADRGRTDLHTCCYRWSIRASGGHLP